MAVDAVSSSSNANAAAIRGQSAESQARRTEREQQSARNERAERPQEAEQKPRPTVNTSGQTVGTRVDTTA